MLAFKFCMNAPQIAATIRCENTARILRLLAVAKQCTEDARDPLVPRELAERLRIGNANEL